MGHNANLRNSSKQLTHLRKAMKIKITLINKEKKYYLFFLLHSIFLLFLRGFFGKKNPVFQSKQDATFSLNWSYREEELTVANFFFLLLRFYLYIHFEEKV